jgi:hypothetical protein
LNIRTKRPGARLGLVSLGAALMLIVAFPMGFALPRVQLLLPILIVTVLVTAHAAWHAAEKARLRVDGRVIAALVIGYLGLAMLVAFTEMFVWAALKSLPTPPQFGLLADQLLQGA